MMNIFVIDIETTGLDGVIFGDDIVEIGVARFDTETKKIYPVFSAVVQHNTIEWPEEKQNAWVFSHTDLTLNDVKNGMNALAVRTVLWSIVNQNDFITSYNEEFDFGKFLFSSPYYLGRAGKVAPCIMKTAAKCTDITLDHAGGHKWPKLQTAYDKLCSDDPANIKGKQDHRALSDALVAAYVMKELIELGYYSTEAVM